MKPIITKEMVAEAIRNWAKKNNVELQEELICTPGLPEHCHNEKDECVPLHEEHCDECHGDCRCFDPEG